MNHDSRRLGIPSRFRLFGTRSNPDGGLIADRAGNLYGTTANGGAAGNGVVFKLSGTGFVP